MKKIVPIVGCFFALVLLTAPAWAQCGPCNDQPSTAAIILGDVTTASVNYMEIATSTPSKTAANLAQAEIPYIANMGQSANKKLTANATTSPPGAQVAQQAAALTIKTQGQAFDNTRQFSSSSQVGTAPPVLEIELCAAKNASGFSGKNEGLTSTHSGLAFSSS